MQNMYIVNVKMKVKIGCEQLYECESDKQQINYQLNSYECAMLNDFELYDINTECALEKNTIK